MNPIIIRQNFVAICKICTIVIIAINLNNLSAQQTRIDSLRHKALIFKIKNPNYSEKHEYIDLLSKIAKEFGFYNIDSTHSIANKTLEYSDKINYEYGKCLSFYNIAKYHSIKGEKEKSIHFYKKALSHIDKKKSREIEIRLYNDMAHEFLYLGNLEKALENYLTGLDKSVEEENLLGQSIINENISNIYAMVEDYDQALMFYKEVDRLNTILGDEIEIAKTKCNISITLMEMEHLSEALNRVDEGIKILRNNDIKNWLAFAYLIKGRIYLKQKKFKWALHWLEKSKNLYNELEVGIGQADLLVSMAMVYSSLNKDSLSYSFAKKAYDLSKKLNVLNVTIGATKTIFEIHKKQNDYKKALIYHEELLKLSDSMSSRANLMSLSLLKTKTRFEKEKEAIIANNNKELAEKQNIITLTVTSLVILLSLALPLYFNRKKLNQLYVQLKGYTNDLKESEKALKLSNATKDRLFSIIGHDLNGPIGALSNLLSLEAQGDIEHNEFKALLPRLRLDIDNILFTLNNLLSWGSSQSKGLVNQPKHIDLNKVLKTTMGLLSQISRNKAITIQNRLPLNCFIYSDQNEIEVVIRNLISNALKFTPENGTIIISGYSKEENYIISVEDNGVGMDAATLQTLFDEHKNTSTYGTNKEKGTGLGLSLCKEMIEANGGNIWVESEPQKGSTFFFTIPKGFQKQHFLVRKSA